MQITCTNLAFSYPEQVKLLFEGVTFAVSDASRLGIIGPNGSGKSTLLGLLTGRLQPTSGTISRSRPAPRIALIEMDTGDRRLVMTSALAARNPLLATAWSIMQSDSDANSTTEAAAEFGAQGGYAVLAEIQRTLAGAGLPEELWGHMVASLSVGERLWLRVAEALLASSDLLILDEPTSHLNIEKHTQLATMLQELDRPYVVVSHDRHFLDLVGTEVLELTHGRARLCAGGYTTYMATVKAEREHDRDIYAVQTRKVKQLKRAIGMVKEQASSIEVLAYRSSSGFFSHKAAKMEKRAKAMRTQLERSLAEATAAKPFIEKKRNYVLEGSPRGGTLISLVRITASAGERILFRDLSLTIRGGEHWCLLGPNGAGKSTLLQMMIGQQRPDAGKAMLSAGQQKRVFIARLVACRPDLLVIDELEGNLAIDAIMLMEQALSQFTEALVMVTHDTALARAVGQQFVSLDGTGGWSQENRFDDGES
jgi:ATPase subunit of ABC transporter with duplicated ATPase domains